VKGLGKGRWGGWPDNKLREAQERMREEKKMRKLLESALRVMEQDERQIDGIKCCSLNSTLRTTLARPRLSDTDWYPSSGDFE